MVLIYEAGPVKYFYSVNKERVGPKTLVEMKVLDIEITSTIMRS